ncbi:iron-dependent transcription repressor related protein [Thermoplasma acidophilum]|uniref:Iron-dependent transcription repressor related protein n=1 Tax=Thermoplasma acidophilum (strain ATCC 25905 / DSM 1728 / JCM 9062 / NBRC 15155 / AMRC-C165) TaxID=273075 RepID=Q9HJU1_THEAC|nr:metal-dependent transcriptional regulator [Thermoplasma acidophilum]MCY0851168.1 metal-dependent transcriptional regulator [Thermoplasma acidophilum]CAC12001.1 iron-dependent transcription repressor related protein [Thermoplasma acidophilum]
MNENRIRSVTEEDYLKIIQELVLYKGYATLADISRSLNVKRQSVRDEINHLISLSMAEKIERGKYRLTPSGDREANRFLRKHRTAEILLSRCIGIPWERVDEEAMGIEHGMTEEIIQRTIERFGVDRCPHGNPIPDPEGNVEPVADVRITSLLPDSTARISRIVYETDDILHFLALNGLIPGKDIKIESVKDTVRVLVDGRSIEIPTDIAMAIMVTVDDR